MDENKHFGDYLFDAKRKFDNFWYHYKFAFLIGLAVLAFVIFCIVQCAAKTKGDVDIAYVGALEIDYDTHEYLQEALNTLLGQDYDGDGKIHVGFTKFGYMTTIQIENERAKGNPVNLQGVVTAQTQVELQLAAGNIAIYLFDLDVYKEYYGKSGVFMPLEEALGYVPEKAYDSYSIRLGDLQCWKYFMGLDNFPASTILVVRDMLVSEEDDEKTQETYRRSLSLFRRMVEFEYLPFDAADELESEAEAESEDATQS